MGAKSFRSKPTKSREDLVHQTGCRTLEFDDEPPSCLDEDVQPAFPESDPPCPTFASCLRLSRGESGLWA